MLFFLVLCCDCYYDFCIKQCSIRLYLQLFVAGSFLVSYLHYLYLLVDNDVQHILCFVFLRIVYPMLPVSLDYPFGLFIYKRWYVLTDKKNTFKFGDTTGVIRSKQSINIWEYRRANQKWTIQRHWQHRRRKTK